MPSRALLGEEKRTAAVATAKPTRSAGAAAAGAHPINTAAAGSVAAAAAVGAAAAPAEESTPSRAAEGTKAAVGPAEDEATTLAAAEHAAALVGVTLIANPHFADDYDSADSSTPARNGATSADESELPPPLKRKPPPVSAEAGSKPKRARHHEHNEQSSSTDLEPTPRRPRQPEVSRLIRTAIKAYSLHPVPLAPTETAAAYVTKVVWANEAMARHKVTRQELFQKVKKSFQSQQTYQRKALGESKRSTKRVETVDGKSVQQFTDDADSQSELTDKGKQSQQHRDVMRRTARRIRVLRTGTVLHF
jgi:hypothetical protein